jgi:hypothetical protein
MNLLLNYIILKTNTLQNPLYLIYILFVTSIIHFNKIYPFMSLSLLTLYIIKDQYYFNIIHLS